MSKEKKKILYLVEAMGGGVVTYIETLANGLKDEFDFVIAYGIRNQTPEDLDAHFDEGIKLIEVIVTLAVQKIQKSARLLFFVFLQKKNQPHTKQSYDNIVLN